MTKRIRGREFLILREENIEDVIDIPPGIPYLGS
jgi:hypothetical protein